MNLKIEITMAFAIDAHDLAVVDRVKVPCPLRRPMDGYHLPDEEGMIAGSYRIGNLAFVGHRRSLDDGGRNDLGRNLLKSALGEFIYLSARRGPAEPCPIFLLLSRKAEDELPALLQTLMGVPSVPHGDGDHLRIPRDDGPPRQADDIGSAILAHGGGKGIGVRRTPFKGLIP